MLVDSCVWTDVVQDPCAPELIGAIEKLKSDGDIVVIVASTVVDDFAQSKSWLLDEGRQSISRTRLLAEAKRGRTTRRSRTVVSELNEIALELLNIGDRAKEMAERIERLLMTAQRQEPTDEVKIRAAERGIQRRAPFHRPRNGIHDAILVEIFADLVRSRRNGQRLAFVTHNVKDFSHPTVNQKAPHPDLAHLFSDSRCRYFVSLGEALRAVRPGQLLDVPIEEERLDQPRRKIAEIVSAEHELFEKIWYYHHCLRQARVAQGQIEIVEQDAASAQFDGRSVKRDIWEASMRAARRIAERHGTQNLGPWNEFEWGMINGKLSALSWALGDEWDMIT
jgi:hypothetical protein